MRVVVVFYVNVSGFLIWVNGYIDQFFVFVSYYQFVNCFRCMMLDFCWNMQFFGGIVGVSYFQNDWYNQIVQI